MKKCVYDEKACEKDQRKGEEMQKRTDPLAELSVYKL
jgi:hypothetical protein